MAAKNYPKLMKNLLSFYLQREDAKNGKRDLTQNHWSSYLSGGQWPLSYNLMHQFGRCCYYFALFFFK
ncbi:MAG: hypothetical protein ACHQUC_01775 [Chlamydiales bacterium]